MIWLFKVNEVFWDDKPKVNEHYFFEEEDINFDFTKYDIWLYFATAHYFILSESNDTEIYSLRFVASDVNPKRELISKDTEVYDIVRNFYLQKNREVKLDFLVK